MSESIPTQKEKSNLIQKCLARPIALGTFSQASLNSLFNSRHVLYVTAKGGIGESMTIHVCIISHFSGPIH